MEHKAKIFARWVLGVHLLSLVVVIGTIFIASKDIYEKTRAQAIVQAEASQELLAKQTAAGIRGFYKSIRDDLDLIHRADNDEASASTSQPTSQPATQAAGATTRPGSPAITLGPFTLPLPFKLLADAGAAGRSDNRTGTIIGLLLWRQLEGRASLLFAVDADRLELRESPQVLQKNPAVRPIGPIGSQREAREVVKKLHTWLSKVDEPSVSTFQEFGDLGAGNVVCVPAPERPGDKARRLLVAYVPIQNIETQFLDNLNPEDNSTTATLADSNMVTMVSSDPALINIDAMQAKDLHVRALAQLAATSDKPVTLPIERMFQLGKVTRNPRMMTMVPVTVVGKRWFLMISSRLSTVDAVVNGVFRKALYWAVLVVIAMTGILVSTSVWMIRGRIRLERVRHEVLTRELDQAREIQKAWLPQKALALPSVDVCAINHPASHISGDFYNWFELPDGRLVVTIGDVTGHGMSAAFLMATTQLLVRTTMMRIGDPGRCMEEVNRQLCTQIFVGQFVTMLIAVLDIGQNELQLATAGHYPPLLGDGETFRTLPMEPQLVLGVEKETEYATEQFDLPAGASLLMYTDGVLDVENPQGKRFGSAGLKTALRGTFNTAQGVLDTMLADIDRFRAGKDLPDDLTLVAVQLAVSSTPKAAVEAVG